MIKAKNLYDVWTDGSYRSDSDTGGAAWLIIHDNVKTPYMATIPKLEKVSRLHGSDIAELVAVGSALRIIPPGSSVHLRLDAQNIIDWLKAGRLSVKVDIEPLKAAFENAMVGIRSMSSVEFTKVSGKNNENLKLVNNMARTKSGLAARAQVPS